MGLTLNQRLERSRAHKEIAENALRTKYLNFQNDNLKQSRKRKIGVTSPGNPERDMSTSDRKRAMAMARQRVEENPIVQAIINARLNNIVGSGLRLMMRSGNIEWDKTVEDWWDLEQDRLDIRGRMPFGWLLRMWQARHDVDGDVGIAMIPDELDGVPLSYVQTWESEQVCKDPNDAKDTGILFDDFGMPQTYYVISDPTDPKSKTSSYPRENFILYANDNTYRANRARGISMFLQVFNLLQDHADIIEGIVSKVKAESWIGLKFWMQPGGDGNLFGNAQTTDTEGLDYSKVEMRSGMNLVLGEGEQAEVLESKSPGSNFDGFEKKMISRIALPFGFTYELLTGDYSAVNDRTARVMIKQFEKHIRPEQKKLGMVASKVFRWALSRAVNGGIITPPAGLKTWFDHAWGKPGFPYINVLQEAQANTLLLEKGLTSRTKILADQGDDDFEDLMDERKYEDEIIKEKGVEVVTVNGQPQNNPALQDTTSQDGIVVPNE